MDPDELQSLLFTLLPTPAYIFGSILFGVLGYAAYRYSKKTGHSKAKWSGVALMFYPYAIGNDTRLLYIVGAALCGVWYFFRNAD